MTVAPVSTSATLDALASAGLSAAMLAHEVNNLMTPVRGRVQLALRNLDNHECTLAALEAALLGAEQSAAIASALLDTVVPQNPAQGMALSESIERARMLTTVPNHVDLHIGQGICDEIIVPGVVVTQVTVNLIKNSLSAIMRHGEHGCIGIDAWLEETTWNLPMAIVRVHDTGGGLQTSDDQPSGYGLGLTICQRLLDTVGGTFEIRNRSDEAGAEATFAVPCCHHGLA